MGRHDRTFGRAKRIGRRTIEQSRNFKIRRHITQHPLDAVEIKGLATEHLAVPGVAQRGVQCGFHKTTAPRRNRDPGDVDRHQRALQALSHRQDDVVFGNDHIRHVHLAQRQEFIGRRVVARSEGEAFGISRNGDHGHVVVAGLIGSLDYGEINVGLAGQRYPSLGAVDGPGAVTADHRTRVHVGRIRARLRLSQREIGQLAARGQLAAPFLLEGVGSKAATGIGADIVHRQRKGIGAISLAQLLVDADAFAQRQALTAELLGGIQSGQPQRRRLVGRIARPDTGLVPSVYVRLDHLVRVGAGGGENGVDLCWHGFPLIAGKRPCAQCLFCQQALGNREKSLMTRQLRR